MTAKEFLHSIYVFDDNIAEWCERYAKIYLKQANEERERIENIFNLNGCDYCKTQKLIENGICNCCGAKQKQI